MAEISDLLEYGAQVRPPGLDELERVAARRRRRATTAAASVTAALVAALVAVAGLLAPGEPETAPVAPIPSVSQSSSAGPSPAPDTAGPFRALSPEEIRRHPDATSEARDLPATAAPGVQARIWSVCLGDCTRATEPVPGERQQALEVTNDGFTTGTLYALDLSENISHAVDDWYFIDPYAKGATLVNGNGELRPLTHGDPTAVTEVAGPLVYSTQGLAWVDTAAGHLHLIEGGFGWDWQGAGDTWFWGTASLVPNTTVLRHVALWRNPDGTFAVRVLPIGESQGTTGMLKSGQPGTLAVVEHFANPRLAHISTDYGATWQVRLVPDDVPSGGRLPASWTTWAPG